MYRFRPRGVQRCTSRLGSVQVLLGGGDGEVTPRPAGKARKRGEGGKGHGLGHPLTPLTKPGHGPSVTCIRLQHLELGPPLGTQERGQWTATLTSGLLTEPLPEPVQSRSMS